MLLQADVTANGAEQAALLKHLQVLGLPTILFFDPAGRADGPAGHRFYEGGSLQRAFAESDVIYPIAFELQLGGKHRSPRELTQVSDWGDKSAGSRFEHCLQWLRKG